MWLMHTYIEEKEEIIHYKKKSGKRKDAKKRERNIQVKQVSSHDISKNVY